MRVVSGRFRGIKLNSPKTEDVRPTGDKVKQAMFTKLQFFVPGADCLDLFSGSGALGIEALSRGAHFVDFVDKCPNSIKLTLSNLEKLKGISGYATHHMAATEFLKATQKTFDLILLDPPYKSGEYTLCLDLIYERKLLNKGGVIVLERSAENSIKTDKFRLTDTKKYGTVCVDYYSCLD